ncbi:nucleotidyltransferase family protein [Anaerovorax odorimutans]|uniref:nucleotidyltransferase family protein n=1 Tax=Anaerovorax odorimutans TaxID=109327 RepID=UPI0004204E50|nr:nucleotidyltransferase domain-containing protein [Anaerovorax odorimutans]
MHLEKNIINKIIEIGKKYNEINRIVLFGSRARGDNSLRSDIDLAIYADSEELQFAYDLEENVDTLLEFDITFVRDGLDKLLLEQIKKDGVYLYEKL